MAPSRSALSILLTTLLAVACSHERAAGVGTAIGASSGVAPAAPARVTQAGGEQVLTLETEAGLYTATSGEDLPMPDALAAAVRLPADARVVTSTRLGDTISVDLHSPRSPGLLLAEFRAAQRAAGWREREVQARAAVPVLGLVRNGQRLEATFLAEPDGGTSLAVTLSPAGA